MIYSVKGERCKRQPCPLRHIHDPVPSLLRSANGPVVCPCIPCQVDAEKGRPMRLARWRDTKMWWAPYGPGRAPTKGTPDRNRAHLFGPRHAAILKANPYFQVLIPREEVARRVATRCCDGVEYCREHNPGGRLA